MIEKEDFFVLPEPCLAYFRMSTHLRFSDCGSARGTVSRTFNGVLSRTQGELAVIISTVSSIRTDLRPDFRSSDVQFVRGSKDSVVLVSIATNTDNNYEEER